MTEVEHVSVSVQDDFVARPLAELIWNGLDADATAINVEFAHDDLAGGMSKIVVYDNGHGFPRSDAKALFGNLGGSWKRLTRQTRQAKRMIPGQEGRDRNTCNTRQTRVLQFVTCRKSTASSWRA